MRAGPPPTTRPTTRCSSSDRSAILVMVGLSRGPLVGLVVIASLIAYGEELGLTGWIERRLDGSIERSIEWSAATVVVIVGVLVLILVGGVLLQVAREVARNWELTLYRTPTGLRVHCWSADHHESVVDRAQGPGDLDRRHPGAAVARLHPAATQDVRRERPRTSRHGGTRSRGCDASCSAPTTHRRSIAASLVRLCSWPFATPCSSCSRWWRWRSWPSDGGLRSCWSSCPFVGSQPACAGRSDAGASPTTVASPKLLQLLVRRTTELPIAKAQVVTVSQSWFERRRDLATLHVRSAEGYVAVPLIPVDDAKGCRDPILHRVETDDRPFL